MSILATSTANAARPWVGAPLVATLVTLAACGGSSDPASYPPLTSDLGLVPPVLEVVEATPADGAVQVAVDQQIKLRFDTAVALDSLLSACPAPLYEAATDQAVHGSWRLLDGGTTAHFEPARGLTAETDYRFELSPMVVAVDGRLLEQAWTATFATVDPTPPTLLHTTPGAGAASDSGAGVVFEFDEPIQSTGITATLREAGSGTEYPVDFAVDGNTIKARSFVDLPGERAYEWRLTGITDIVGNASTDPVIVLVSTLADSTAPRLVSIWPDEGEVIAPGAALRLEFTESIDVAGLAENSFQIWTSSGSVEADCSASADLRSLWLQPRARLTPGQYHSLILRSNLTDTSGNSLATEFALTFEVGHDERGPALLSCSPADGAEGVPTDRLDRIEARFDEALDPGSAAAALLRAPLRPDLPTVQAYPTGERGLRFEPAERLAPGTLYEIVLRGPGATAADPAIRDASGNPLLSTVTVQFRTAADHPNLAVQVWPPSGTSGLPRNAGFSLLADRVLDPESCREDAFLLADRDGAELSVTVRQVAGGRGLRIEPQDSLAADSVYTLSMRAGDEGGLRGADGSWLGCCVEVRIATGSHLDNTPPTVEVTLDEIADERKAELGVAPYGFCLDIEAHDSLTWGVDWTSLDLQLEGAAGAPTTETLWSGARVLDARHLQIRIPVTGELAIGGWSFHASVADLVGNRAQSQELRFDVVEPSAVRQPFERTQVVWVRTDLDRDGDGRDDFLEDLLALGLCAENDPIGRNAAMARLVSKAIARRANELYEREASGARRPDGASAPVLFTVDEPVAVPTAMQVACGGTDPEARPDRVTGDQSSGTLGRAWFDHRNLDFNENAMDTSPGLGVFPRELYLFEARIHLDLYPAYLTSFGRRFLPLSPNLGGTPAGTHALDSRVLAADFDPAAATSAERARHDTIMDAADDWACAIGTILAHETGHAVGLVADGDPGFGLHGDATLHNRYAGITDVMSPTLGFDAMVSLGYRFRDLNLAYLRQRVLLK